MNRVDIMVVGAGYAGLAAASQLPGRSVCILERADSVVERRRGSLGLLLPLGARARVQGDDLKFDQPSLLVEGAVHHRLERVVIRGLRTRLELKLATPLLVLNESRIKGALLRLARERGCQVLVNNPVRKVEHVGEHVKVWAEQQYRCRVLIGADGASSLVARSLGLQRSKRGLLFARQFEVDRLDVPGDTLLVQLDDYRKSYWAFSTGGRYRAAVVQVRGIREPAGDLDGDLHDWCERLGGGRLLDAYGAVVRLLEPAGDCCRQQSLLAGDALAFAGFCSITGALAMGALAGQVAGRLLAGSGYALGDYQRNWRRVSGQHALQRLGLAAPLWRRLNGERLDRLLDTLATRSGRLPWGWALVRRLPALLLDLLL